MKLRYENGWDDWDLRKHLPLAPLNLGFWFNRQDQRPSFSYLAQNIPGHRRRSTVITARVTNRIDGRRSSPARVGMQIPTGASGHNPRLVASGGRAGTGPYLQ